jgi:DNA-binding PadR family transcriptional regulator
MKNIKIEKQLTVQSFIALLNKGYSGAGDDKVFTITSLGGKELEEHIIIPQRIMQFYNLYVQTKCLLEEELENWK